MGGEDKAGSSGRGKALVEHMHPVLRPLTDDLIISCNRNQPRYGCLADRSSATPTPIFQARSLASSGAQSSQTPTHAGTLPCDAPLIDLDLIEQLTFCPMSTPVLCQQDGFCSHF